jgi:predicted XRE-type DNA-binding protein
LPKNATPAEKAKYEICEKILIYQQDNNLSDEEIASKIKLTVGETRDILYYHIDYFTLDRLINYANQLFKPLSVNLTINYGTKKREKATHVSAV